MPSFFRHIILIVLILGAFSVNAQEPVYERHFDDDFKSRYSNGKYDYDGDVEVKNELETTDGKFSEYENITPKEKEENNSTINTVGGNLLTWIFIIILIIAVVYVLYSVMNEGQSGLFTKGKSKKIESPEINVNTIAETDLLALISSAEEQGDFRLAVRFLYLLVLKTLTIKNVIKYEDDKTDSDYLSEIGQQSYSSSFAQTAYLYNYVWYGVFLLNQQQYGKAKNSFENLLKNVR